MTEALLMANGRDGSFLLRKLQDGYCVSVRGKDSVKHFKIEVKNNGVTFAKSNFQSFHQLLKVLASQVILSGATGDLTKNFEQGTLLTLKYPYPKKVAEPDTYDESMVFHSTIRSQVTLQDLNMKSQAEPLASKSGFLTKQGGNVKSWKLRWFVIVRNEMSYFADRSSEKPIRTLDLTECSNVGYSNDIDGNSNCFYLQFPDRIWNLSANSQSELKEWITILQWKVNQNKLQQN